MAGISGEVDWGQLSFELTAGAHSLVWTYAKDGANSGGSDAGWVDMVSLGSPLFFDDFRDGGPAGDPEWTKILGIWKVKRPLWYGDKLYVSSRRSKAVTLVKNLSLTGGRIESKFKIGGTLARRSIMFLFDYRYPTHFRYVQLKQRANGSWKMYLRQKGDYDGDVSGTKAAVPLAGFVRGRVHDLGIDTYAAGNIKVWLDGILKINSSFAGAAGGGSVGLRSDKTALFADKFTVFDEAILP